MRSVTSSVLALAATSQAAYQGFNYGSTFSDGSIKSQSDFEAEFKAAKGLEGTNGDFTSARLYTMIQGGTTKDPISAIPAAMNTGTSLLLGLWCSAGDETFANELAALKNAITTYGSAFTSLVAGISVGSEDLYRISPAGIENKEYAGAQPDTIAGYIAQVRQAIAGTGLAGAKIGHVDTWTSWANSSNAAVIDVCDWIGMDAYPYFEKEHANGIDNGKALFEDALAATSGGVGGKEIWVTETGWPVSGKTVGEGVASPANAKTYWDEVGCPMFGVKNVWWYTFQDSNPTTPNPSFGVIGSSVTTTPLYDLSCSNSSSHSNGTATTSSGSATGTGISKPMGTSSGSPYGNSTCTTCSGSGSSSSSGSGSGSSSGSASGSGSGSSSSSSSSSGSGSGSNSNSTVTTSGSGSAGTAVTAGSASLTVQGMGAALVAVFAAMFAL